MGTALIKSFPEAARRIKPLDNVLQSLRNRPRWSLLHELTHARDPEVVRRPEFSEPLSAALELAILAVMENHSVRPHWVVGHSSGEIAAAYVAGFLPLEDAIKIAYFRGQAAQGACDTVKERMGMTPEAHEKERPTNVTLAGVLSALEEVQARLRQDDHACRMLQVDIPYHSKFVAATAEAFEQFTLQERPLVQELGCSGGVTNAVDRHWQPIGGPDLQQLILESQLGVSSSLYLAGYPVQMKAAYPLLSDEAHSVIVDLPNYRWNHPAKYWYKREVSKDGRVRKVPHRDLGSEPSLGASMDTHNGVMARKTEELNQGMQKTPETTVSPGEYGDLLSKTLSSLSSMLQLTEPVDPEELLSSYGLDSLSRIQPRLWLNT
ncbi:polyketide synthase, putative [Aspergillus fumigatus Z5]|nr:polyketide synthase, putative [Aspergillus fumigatus Z5]